jgi:hypothetical protein
MMRSFKRKGAALRAFKIFSSDLRFKQTSSSDPDGQALGQPDCREAALRAPVAGYLKRWISPC